MVPAYGKANCIDTTGVGDNFASGFISAYLRGQDLLICGQYANAVASVSVEHVGATTGVKDLQTAETRYQEYLKYGDLDIIQAKYSVLDRQTEEELLPLCKENGIVLQAYSPLEQGLLSGTYTKDYKPQGAQYNKKWFQAGNMEKVIDMTESWGRLCDKYQCTIPSLALAWVLAQGDCVTILSGACAEKEIRENVRAAELELEKEDIQWMREMAENLEK